MIKKLLIIFLSLVLLANLSLNKVIASENIQDNTDYKKIILIINQVRGNECCDVGNINHLKQQLDSLQQDNLKGNFSIRYDALFQDDVVNILKNQNKNNFELGAFLEITPQLADDSGVSYNGELKDWYKAQNIYTLGYDKDDRKKILDTYFKKFYSVFGENPKFSTAWIMDTYSVEYLKEKYNIFAHQITREQWGTDSYTLSGGPVHYPYFSNENWLFSKSSLKENENQLLILRQTGSDPLFNYGDTTSSFTTQPNDYGIKNRGFEYFKNLKNELLNQKQNSYGFLLLGLENSMDKKYQDEFSKQLESISDDDENETMLVSDFYKVARDYNQDVTGIQGHDFVNNTDLKSFWINTTNYRVRLILKNKNLYISDLRLNNEALSDPYNDYVARDLAFWVSPYIFNSSRHYSLNEPENLSSKDKILNKIRKAYLPELNEKNLEIKTSKSDADTYFEGFLIYEGVDSISDFYRNSKGNLALSFNTIDSIKRNIDFSNKKISTDFLLEKENVILTENSLVTLNSKGKNFYLDFGIDKVLYSAEIECSLNNSCNISFDQPDNIAFKQIQEDLYPYFFPEIKERLASSSKSVFYPHNRYAILGKNPVRFVFIPKDDKGFATTYENDPEVVVYPSEVEISLHDKQSNGTTFLDINSQKSGKFNVKFSVNEVLKEETVYFAKDCKTNLAYCLLHPVELKWYLSSMFYTKLRDF